MACKEADKLRGSLFHFSPVSFEGEGKNDYFDLTPFLFSFKSKKRKTKKKNPKTHFQGYEVAKT